MTPPPPRSTLFPYTTLFRSLGNYTVEGLELAVASFLTSAHAVYGVTHLAALCRLLPERDRKSTRLNSSHTVISYAVFCLKKKIHTLSRFTCSANMTDTPCWQ